ncbi:NAPDH-dependent diflavin reductase [Coemansia sp. RSA 678]|nr:NAPDH-dependent diflavin reductase [Coemansia sp. RSA 678]
MGDIIYRLSSMKFEDPADGEQVLVEKYTQLQRDIEEHLKNVMFGLGDSSYQKSNFSAKQLFKQQQQLGGTPIVDQGDGDDQNYLGLDGVLDQYPLPKPIVPDKNEKEWLHEFTTSEGKDELQTYCMRSRWTIVENTIYVQQWICKQGSLLWLLISKQDTIVYVSGNANWMPDDVAAYVKVMVKTGRYQEECWY